MRSLRLRPRALADLDGIWLYIAEDNMQAADRVIDDFTETFRLLCVTPHMGTAIANRASVARGVSPLVTEAGPLDRITARAPNSARNASVTLLKGWISQ